MLQTAKPTQNRLNAHSKRDTNLTPRILLTRPKTHTCIQDNLRRDASERICLISKPALVLLRRNRMVPGSGTVWYRLSDYLYFQDHFSRSPFLYPKKAQLSVLKRLFSLTIVSCKMKRQQYLFIGLCIHLITGMNVNPRMAQSLDNLSIRQGTTIPSQFGPLC